MKPRLNISD